MAMALIRWDLTGDDGRRVDGEAVYLRHPKPSDYEAWAALRAESANHLQPWEPSWTSDELTRAAYRRRLRRYADDIRDGLAMPFFFLRQSDDALLGGLTFSNIRRGVAQACSLGYWIGAPHVRQGYTRDAARAACRYGFHMMGLHRIEAAVIPTNAASRAVLEGVGFTQEGFARAYLKIAGQWRDHLLYGLVSGDPLR
jgi:ribosomal-protein-alanine N-acetyltransferase